MPEDSKEERKRKKSSISEDLRGEKKKERKEKKEKKDRKKLSRETSESALKKRDERPNNMNFVQAIALYNYKPEQADEIPLKKGDMLIVYEQHPSGWWTGWPSFCEKKKHATRDANFSRIAFRAYQFVLKR